jgi:hypothetical protein
MTGERHQHRVVPEAAGTDAAAAIATRRRATER